MDIRFLTTFIEVVNTRHFGKAAENLYLTQSAVSARIKLLEEYFHTTLFVRQRNSIQLTQSGEKLLPFAKQLCSTLQLARQELLDTSSEQVMVGATQVASELLLSDSLTHLHQHFPDWSVKAEVLTLEALSRQLHERVIDLAFSSEPLKSEEVDSHVVLSSPLALYAVDRNGEATSDEFIAIDWGARARDVLLTNQPQLKEAKLRTNSLHLALATLRKEGGFVVLPEACKAHSDGSDDLRHICTLEDAVINVYLHTMKSVRRESLKSIIDSFIAQQATPR
ncbi:LysR family transcriptional regulator [Alteromonas halophila]|uniref:LysR family transcriptional regulator n=1 Tax=Alteromonas halophila TaxID=516698 RepID=A0A918JMF9_9ALTE|nr:LysR family transcriptional regulator [Alteromonas halophila]GGW89846.1 LysR family transcriptional regulator [Alteromonas halophila]